MNGEPNSEWTTQELIDYIKGKDLELIDIGQKSVRCRYNNGRALYLLRQQFDEKAITDLLGAATWQGYLKKLGINHATASDHIALYKEYAPREHDLEKLSSMASFIRENYPERGKNKRLTGEAKHSVRRKPAQAAERPESFEQRMEAVRNGVEQIVAYAEANQPNRQKAIAFLLEIADACYEARRKLDD